MEDHQRHLAEPSAGHVVFREPDVEGRESLETSGLDFSPPTVPDARRVEWVEPRRWRGDRWSPSNSLMRGPPWLMVVSTFLWATVMFFAVYPTLTLGFGGVLVGGLYAVLIFLVLDWLRHSLSKTKITLTTKELARSCGGVIEKWPIGQIEKFWFTRSTYDGRMCDVLNFVASGKQQTVAVNEEADRAAVESLLEISRNNSLTP